MAIAVTPLKANLTNALVNKIPSKLCIKALIKVKIAELSKEITIIFLQPNGSERVPVTSNPNARRPVQSKSDMLD